MNKEQPKLNRQQRRAQAAFAIKHQKNQLKELQAKIKKLSTKITDIKQVVDLSNQMAEPVVELAPEPTPETQPV